MDGLKAKDFNPRSRVGNDRVMYLVGQLKEISIHVPAWGTTERSKKMADTFKDFNPRSRVGNDADGTAVYAV